MTKHKLVIKSLHDTQADCSQEDWYFVATGEKTKQEIKKEFNKHIEVKA